MPGVATSIQKSRRIDLRDDRPRLSVLTGPTGVGKTALSLDLARALNAEIVSFDSRQIYREMDIGTAKPTSVERAGIPHHFIDERDPNDVVSAGAYARDAWSRIEEILARGRRPLLVGGSTLYLRAVTQGMADIPPSDPAVRARLNARLTVEGSSVLFQELLGIDPDAAATMDETKSQRIVRALEVYESTGSRLSDFHRQHRQPPYDFSVLVLDRTREQLYRRIEARVDEMIEMGLVDEVRALIDRYGVTQTPLKTIGYREVIDHLEGSIDLDRAIALIKRNTRRYAKRQLTWFRAGASYAWAQADETTTSDLVDHFAA